MKLNQYPNKKDAGFTLAELLMVIGILSILLTIGMLSIHIYAKNLKMTEMDATAKQIFIAAQNHMTALKSSGEWDTYQKERNMLQNQVEVGLGKVMAKPSDYPTTQPWSNSEIGTEGEHHYYVVGHRSQEDDLSQSVLEQLLPKNAIDDIVRNDGKYVIEYDYATATVYGVFYTDTSEDFSYENDIMGTNGLDVQGGRQSNQDGKKIRKEYKNSSGKNMIIGYYGGATSTVLSSKTLTEPIITVDNGERLCVTITDQNDRDDETHIELEILGEESGAVKQVQLSANKSDSWWSVSVTNQGSKKEYQLVLDDITKQGGHFADLFEGFIPGEDILIQATCSSNTVLANLASSQASTNSLFANKTQIIYTTDANASYAKVTIENGRHLQNLSPDISGLPVQAQIFGSTSSDNSSIVPIAAESIIKEVEQTKEIDWDEFWNRIGSSNHIYLYNEQNSSAEQAVEEQAFYPISNRAIRLYEGFGKKISNLTITDLALSDAQQANSGMFAEIGSVDGSQELTIQNLILQDASCIGTKNAGVLLGEAKQNTKFIAKNIQLISPNVQAGKSAGSVLGKAEGNVTTQISSVQVIDPSVQAQENSGGIVGTMSSGTIAKSSVFFTYDEKQDTMTASEKYKSGAYSEETKQYGTQYSISSSTGSAGGVVGSLEKTANIKQSFASVPVISETGSAGGLIGENKGNGSWITNSYSGGYTEEGLYTQSYSVAAINTDSGIAGGLLGKNTGSNMTIQNSYANGSVFGKQIGGFVGSDESDSTTYLNCYATGLVTGSTTEGAVVGAFAGRASTTNEMKYCYYLIDSNKNSAGVGQGTDTSIGKSYEDLQNAKFQEIYNESGHRITPTLSDDTIETHAYDEFYTGETYPFPVVTATGYQGDEENSVRTHYGDWQKLQKTTGYSFNMGFVYYELLEDQDGNPDPTFYYHGWGGLQGENEYDPDNYIELLTQGDGLVDGLSREPNKYVYQEGYILLVDKNVDLSRLGIRIKLPNDSNIRYSNLVLSTFTKKNLELPEELENYDVYELNSDILNQWFFQQGIPELILGYLSEPNNVWGATMTEKVGFSMNHAFADSAKFIGETFNSTLYTIRSVRQLYNLENNNALSGWGGENNRFVQTLDIDVNREVNGKVYEMKRIENMTASYVSENYQYSIETYKIIGLNIQLFGTIQATAVMKGITLVDLTIQSGGEVSGFASANYGTIESCSIRPSGNNLQSYEAVKIQGSNAYGFVKSNMGSGKIKNSYVSGTIIGSDVASGFTGENQSDASIESCYVSAIIMGNTNASGFILESNANLIKNCFVVGSVSSNEMVAGFVSNSNQTSGKYINCYTALWKLSGKQVYMFGFSNSGEIVENCYWLDSGQVIGDIVQPPYPGRYDRAEARNYSAMRNNKDVVTHKYNTGIEGTDVINSQYPFIVTSTSDVYHELEFWGDWPSAPAQSRMGLIYYEVVDNELYYHGYLVNFEGDEVVGSQEIMTSGYTKTKGLLEEEEKDIEDSGYLILAEDDAIPTIVQTTSDSTDIVALKKSKLTVPIGSDITLQAYTIVEHIETDANVSRTLTLSLKNSRSVEQENERISFTLTLNQKDSIQIKK